MCYRIWCLNLLSEIEKNNNKNLTESCLVKELGLCNKFLEKDERNFHVWNYRLTIFKMIYKFFKLNFWDFLIQELEFTLKMIKKSFSNFSAWHYRSKLITLDLINKNISWSSPKIIKYFEVDLFYLKNAIFTDPRDQSPWNYYNWIIYNITPLFVKSIDKKKEENNFLIKINFSQKIPILKFLKIVKEEDLNLSINENEKNSKEENLEISDFVKIENLGNSENSEKKNSDFFSDEIVFDFSKLLEDKKLEEGKKYKIKIEADNNLDTKSNIFSDDSVYFSNKLIPLKNNLDFPIIRVTIDKNGVIVGGDYNSYKNNSENCNFSYDHLKDFLNNQIVMINELIKVTDGFIENAHFRKTQIMLTQYYLCFDKENKDMIVKELNLLIEKSKRMKVVYKELLESIL